MPAAASDASVGSSQYFATVRSVTTAVRTPGRKAAIGAAAHTAHDDVVICLEPDRDRLGGNPGAGLLAHESAAAGRQHHRFAIQQTRDHPRLAVAEMPLAMAFKNLRYAHAGCRLDL